MPERTRVPFNVTHRTDREVAYVTEAIRCGRLSGGRFTEQAEAWLERYTGTERALLTTSCTTALELCALLADIRPGDEIIMPSYTYVSTANAFVLRGAVPVFVDIRPDTLNINEAHVERAITRRTRAIVPVHYAGVPAAMDPLREIALAHGLLVIEDAAQALHSTYRGSPAGSIGHLGAVSFHETKNVIAGEGGALLINEPGFTERAVTIYNKGTNFPEFQRGAVGRYWWTDVGSSYHPSEITAAFLYAQLEQARDLLDRRLALWYYYHDAFADLAARELLRRPQIPADVSHNGHIYYLILPSPDARSRAIANLLDEGIAAQFHYPPLHSTPGGRKFGHAGGPLHVTEDLAARILRLPLFASLDEQTIDYVVQTVTATIRP